MTDQTPPIDPGNIRVILHVPNMAQQIFADVAVSELPRWLGPLLDEGASALTPPRPPLVRGSEESSRTVNELFDVALSLGETGRCTACLAALWICLYASPMLPGLGLQLADFEAVAGRGVLRVYLSADENASFFEYHLMDGANLRLGGLKEIPRQPQWAQEPMGSA